MASSAAAGESGPRSFAAAAAFSGETSIGMGRGRGGELRRLLPCLPFRLDS